LSPIWMMKGYSTPAGLPGGGMAVDGLGPALGGADHKGSITEEAYSVTGKRKGLPALSTKVAPWRLEKWCAPADQSQI